MNKYNFNSEIKELLTIEHGFKPMEQLAKRMIRENVSLEYAYELYENQYHQVRMLAVYILGEYMTKEKKVVSFLKNTVSIDTSWQVQEILAKVFDSYCKIKGYENALPDIEEWLADSNPNVRRAVSEGLRVWTSRPYFREHPEKAISCLFQLKNDSSEYVRKSCGNALRDISKKYPDLVKTEFEKIGNTSEEVHIKKLILKNKNF